VSDIERIVPRAQKCILNIQRTIPIRRLTSQIHRTIISQIRRVMEFPQLLTFFYQSLTCGQIFESRLVFSGIDGLEIIRVVIGHIWIRSSCDGEIDAAVDDAYGIERDKKCVFESTRGDSIVLLRYV
jgi:hypothetical protein